MGDVSRDRFHSEPRPADWDLVRAAGVPRECFADEVAIDFPSVDRFVERLREEFARGTSGVWEIWGEDVRRTLTAAVAISRREAFVGVLVPLEVPVRRTCAACGGRGESWTDQCRACVGLGDAPATLLVRVPLPPGLADGARLRFRLSSPDAPPMRLDIHVSIAGWVPGL
jgi:hypothetical protein